MEREALTLDNLALRDGGARTANGFVIAQVERICAHGALNPRQRAVPGVLVDCVVVARPKITLQTYGTAYNPAFSGELRVPLDMLGPMPLDERKLIARRCAFELPMGGVINLGIGMPEGVAPVANEEKRARPPDADRRARRDRRHAAGRARLRRRRQHRSACIHQNQQFDFYDGGGLDLACLGMAQVDAHGNVNVSRFGPRLAGAGGFINISQNARRLLFAGTFTAGGLEVAIEDGKLAIVREGKRAQVRRRGRADHLQRRLRGRDRAAGALRDRALRVQAQRARAWS